MTFSDFANKMYPLIGRADTTYTFVLCLTDQIMKLPSTEAEQKKEAVNKYNPLYEYNKSMLQKIYNGKRQISAEKARIIYSHIDKNRFTDFLSEFPDDVIESIHAFLQENGRKFDDRDTLDECANLFESILYSCASKDKTRDKRTPIEKAIGLPKNCNIPLATFMLSRAQKEREQLYKHGKEPRKLNEVISKFKSRSKTDND